MNHPWVAWSLGPNRWTKTHYAPDGITTLCGVRVPAGYSNYGMVFDVQWLGTPHSGPDTDCLRCEQKHEKDG